MIQSLTHLSIGPIELIVRASVVYCFVLLLLRMGGKRQLSQMSPTEFVAILLISNAVQNSMNGGDNSLNGGLILAAVIIILSWLIGFLTFRSRFFERLFEGSPTLLIHNGRIVEKNAYRERISPEELRSMLRQQGIHSVHEVHTAVLEADGGFSVTRMSEMKPLRE